MVRREAGLYGMNLLPEKRGPFRVHRELIVQPDRSLIEKHVMIRA
jgi:hypothetical protein